MSMRVTITATGVTTEWGVATTVGQIITVPDDYGLSLVRSLKATDTDGVLSAPARRPFDTVPVVETDTARVSVPAAQLQSSVSGVATASAPIPAANTPFIASAGDSHTFRNMDNVGFSFPVTTNQGYLPWACGLSGHRVRQGISRGISGANSASILSTALPVVLNTANNPSLKYVVVNAGLNDWPGVRTIAALTTAMATWRQNMATIFAQIVAFGATPIITLLPRRTDSANVLVQAVWDQGWREGNAWLKRTADANRWPWWDPNRYWIDPTTDAILSGNSADQCHPVPQGARNYARPLADLLASIEPEADWVTSPGFVATPFDVTIPVGTGGTIGANSSLVTASPSAAAVVPQGWSVGDLNGTNTAAGTWTRDGVGFLTLNIPLAAAASGIHQLLSSTTGVSVGQKWCAFCDIQVENGDRGLYAAALDLLGNGGVAATDMSQNGTTTIFYPTGTETHRMVTPVVTIASGSTVQFRLKLRYTAPLATGAIDIRVLAAGLHRVA